MGESVSNGTLWDTRRPPRGNIALPIMGLYLVDLIVPPYSWDLNGDHGFKFRTKGELSCLGLRQRFLLRGCVWAAGQNPVKQRAGETPLIGEEKMSSSSQILENLGGLTEKVGNLGLQLIRKNCCGAAKKWARKAKLAEAPTGNSGGGQPPSDLGDQLQTLQKPGISEAHYGRGPVSAEQKSPENKGHPQGPSI